MDELKNKLDNLQSKLDALIKKLDPQSERKQLRELEAKTMKTGFWDDESHARQVTQDLSDIKEELELIENLQTSITDTKDLIDLAKKEKDPTSISKEISKEIKGLQSRLSELEIKTFLSGTHDKGNAILSLHSGQGGVEAMDWAAMLLRMYVKFLEKNDWNYELVSETKGEEAGIKSATLLVKHKFAYGYLKGEAGTHRLVRQSPFNADNLRQTSFALVEVLPVIAETDDIQIKPDEIEFHAFRSSGKGGQNVNKVSTAVRLKHIPTGITVESQSQRHQEQNRKIALQLLQAKLWQRAEEKRQKQVKQLKGEHKIAGWGNQIRSYVLHPYKMVKDLRTKVQSNEPDKVLAGDLDQFIQAELRQQSQ